jgi:hypothetical protein
MTAPKAATARPTDAEIRKSLQTMTEFAAIYVFQYHESMKGYRKATHDALDKEIETARALLASLEES